MTNTEKEIAKILDAKNRIPENYSDYLRFQILEKDCPLFVCLELGSIFLKHKDMHCAAVVADSILERGDKHPLIDDFISDIIVSIGSIGMAVDYLHSVINERPKDYLIAKLESYERNI